MKAECRMLVVRLGGFGRGTLSPHLAEGFSGGGGHVSYLGPAGGYFGEGLDPVGAFGSAAEVPLLEGADEAVHQGGFEALGPGSVDQALRGACDFGVHHVSAEVDQVLGDVDFHRTGFVAGAAE